jgi:hypothetical protein
LNEIQPFPQNPSSIRVALKARSGEPFSRLEPGERLAGTVLKVIGSNQAVVRFEGRDLLVETRIPLSEGLHGMFVVESTEPGVVLRLLAGPTGEGLPLESWLKKGLSADLPLSALSERWSALAALPMEEMPPSMKETWEGLLGLLRGFAGGGDSGLLLEGLARSGLFSEAGLRRLIEAGPGGEDPEGVGPDIKGLLLKLVEEVTAASGAEAEPGRTRFLMGLEEGAEGLLRKIELFQGLNLNHSDPGTRILFLLPLFFQDQLRFGELCLRLPPREGGRERAHEASLLFLLDLPALGKMKIEVRILEKELYCLFTLPACETSDWLAQAFSDLSGRLDGLGYRSRVSFQPEGAKPLPASLAQEMIAEVPGMVNIRI